jgi:hypothetical protein
MEKRPMKELFVRLHSIMWTLDSVQEVKKTRWILRVSFFLPILPYVAAASV